MDMVSGREGDWVDAVMKTHCKKHKINAKLERAEINPKKRMTTNSYDSSTDVFKIDLVYKDTKGGEHELKWLIKVSLLRKEKYFYIFDMYYLICTMYIRYFQKGFR